MVAPQRFTHDFKPVVFRQRRAIHSVPWFIVGLGIPLLCVGFIAPRNDRLAAPESIDAAAQAITLADIAADGTQAPLRTAKPGPAGDLIADAIPGKELTLKVRRGDSLDRLFRRNQLKLADLAGIMELKDARKHLRLIRPGDEILIRQNSGQILELTKAVSLREALQIRQVEGAFEAALIQRKLNVQRVHATRKIKSSLFLAAAEAGISDRTIMNLAGIFAWDVDFMLDIREGDEFTLIYEQLWQGGERLADSKILAAEFVNRGKTFRAVRFEDPNGRVDYFNPDGMSVRKAFVRAPLAFSRISSNFNPRRRHPRLNTIRAHRGVDYAAPAGTPIKAAGDGKMTFRNRKGGYGKTVILQHGGNITTLYAHLSRYSKVREGGRVRQGDIIGYVGSTGLATGPHLHYEYRRNGVHLNPRTVKLPDAKPIDPIYREEFERTALPLLHQLENPRTLFAARSPNPTS